MCETDGSGIGNCICPAGFRVNRSGGCRGTQTHNMHPQELVDNYFTLILSMYMYMPYTLVHTLGYCMTFLHTSDINECRTDSHGCEQNCQNTKGSYQCFCNEGYALHIGQKYCTSKYIAIYV